MTTNNKATGKATIERVGTPSSTDHEVVRQLAQLLKETGLTEIEIEQTGFRIRVAKQPATTMSQIATTSEAPALSPASVSHEAVPQTSSDIAVNPGAILSPMVGTAYIAPKPTDPPFVNVGDIVDKGQTVMIIEAMKTMNPIPAPKSGRVSQILVSNAQPVEFGEPLLIID